MRKEIIESYIDQMVRSLGRVRAPVADEELLPLFEAKDYKGMINVIRTTMKLNCRVFFGITPKKGPDTPAWIESVHELPMFGTKNFAAAVVHLGMHPDFVKSASFEAMVFAIAHELSHVILHSLKHALRHEEVAVDLTAMLLGYRDFYVTGCVISESTGKSTQSEQFGKFSDVFSKLFEPRNSAFEGSYTLGYLNREEVHYAARYMTTGK